MAAEIVLDIEAQTGKSAFLVLFCSAVTKRVKARGYARNHGTDERLQAFLVGWPFRRDKLDGLWLLPHLGCCGKLIPLAVQPTHSDGNPKQQDYWA